MGGNIRNRHKECVHTGHCLKWQNMYSLRVAHTSPLPSGPGMRVARTSPPPSGLGTRVAYTLPPPSGLGMRVAYTSPVPMQSPVVDESQLYVVKKFHLRGCDFVSVSGLSNGSYHKSCCSRKCLFRLARFERQTAEGFNSFHARVA